MVKFEFNITNTLIEARNQNSLPATNSSELNFTGNIMQGRKKNVFYGSNVMGDNNFSYLKMVNP